MPKVPRLLVGCQCDRENINPPHPRYVQVTESEINELCQRLGSKYYKTSALTDYGIKECLDTAIKMGVNFKKIKGHPPVQPELKFTKITLETSTFSEDWQKVLQSTSYYDVVFIVEETEQLLAHKIVLCSTSKIFTRIIGT
jgi:hypothetical protein